MRLRLDTDDAVAHARRSSQGLSPGGFEATAPPGQSPFSLRLCGTAIRDLPVERRILQGSDGLIVGRAQQIQFFNDVLKDGVIQYISREHFRVQCAHRGFLVEPLSGNPMWRSRNGDLTEARKGRSLDFDFGDRIVLFTGATDSTPSGIGNKGSLFWSFDPGEGVGSLGHSASGRVGHPGAAAKPWQDTPPGGMPGPPYSHNRETPRSMENPHRPQTVLPNGAALEPPRSMEKPSTLFHHGAALEPPHSMEKPSTLFHQSAALEPPSSMDRSHRPQTLLLTPDTRESQWESQQSAWKPPARAERDQTAGNSTGSALTIPLDGLKHDDMQEASELQSRWESQESVWKPRTPIGRADGRSSGGALKIPLGGLLIDDTPTGGSPSQRAAESSLTGLLDDADEADDAFAKSGFHFD